MTHTVLVVDDDRLNRCILSQVLEARKGYRVLEAEGGEEAVEILTKNPGIELLITDVNMPGMGGEELARVVRQHDPAMCICFYTAHRDYRPPRDLCGARTHVIEKPINVDVVATTISGLLDE